MGKKRGNEKVYACARPSARVQFARVGEGSSPGEEGEFTATDERSFVIESKYSFSITPIFVELPLIIHITLNASRQIALLLL